MKIDGQYTFQVPREKLWELLNNPEVLQRVSPGIKQLELVEPDKYNAIAEVKMGPVKGKFKGTLEVTDKVELERFTMTSKLKGTIGSATAVSNISLAPDGDGTTVTYEADAKLTGMMATMGQRLVSGAAKSMTDEFFSSLEQELANAS